LKARIAIFICCSVFCKSHILIGPICLLKKCSSGDYKEKLFLQKAWGNFIGVTSASLLSCYHLWLRFWRKLII